ncbi:MATE family efflux transporter [Cetobacterium sp. SF1]|uniref:MATE family efflux transporter n=1 Tax=Cetobacterium sp. SF1 TaxID=3417654 RepID=UPI003CF1B16A
MKKESLVSEFERQGVLATILKFSIPSSIGAIIGMLCVLTDRFFIGQVAGRAGMSAIAIVFPYTMLINSVNFLFSGVAIIIGVKLGEGQRKEAEKILGSSFLWIILIGTLVSLILGMFNDNILRILGATDSNFLEAKEYTKYIIPITTFQILLGQSTLVRGIGDPITSMGVNIFTATVNVILDYIFIMKLSMGILGASLATFIATALSAIYIVIYFSKSSVIQLKVKNMTLNFQILKEVFRIGSPRFYNQILQSLLVIVTNKKAGIYGGDIATAAIGIISIIRNVINTSMQGFNQGTAAIISYNYGACNYKRVRKVLGVQIKTVGTISAGMVILMLIFSQEIAGIFVKSDLELVKYTAHAMRINLCLMVSTAIFLACNNFFQSIKESKVATRFFFIRIVLLNIPLVYILSYFIGANGVWMAFPMSDTIVALGLYIITQRKLRTLK